MKKYKWINELGIMQRIGYRDTVVACVNIESVSNFQLDCFSLRARADSRESIEPIKSRERYIYF